MLSSHTQTPALAASAVVTSRQQATHNHLSKETQTITIKPQPISDWAENKKTPTKKPSSTKRYIGPAILMGLTSSLLIENLAARETSIARLVMACITATFIAAYEAYWTNNNTKQVLEDEYEHVNALKAAAENAENQLAAEQNTAIDCSLINEINTVLSDYYQSGSTYNRLSKQVKKRSLLIGGLSVIPFGLILVGTIGSETFLAHYNKTIVFRYFAFPAAGVAILNSIPLLMCYLAVQQSRVKALLTIKSIQESHKTVALLVALKEKTDDITSALTHEIGNKLNGIAPILEMAKSAMLKQWTTKGGQPHAKPVIQDPFNRTLCEDISSALSNTRSTINLLYGILDQQHPKTTQNTQCNVSELCLLTVTEQKTYARNKKIMLAHTIEPNLYVQSYPEKIRQIVENLIGNALKFTPTNGKIEIQLKRSTDNRLAGSEAKEQDNIVLSVSDTGCGFSEKTAALLFGKFKQGPHVNGLFGGHGLGLSLVKKNVELTQGKIVGESPGEGRGATFTVWLPALPVNESPLQPLPPISRPSLETLCALDRHKHYRLLVVEDNVINEKLLIRFLMTIMAKLLNIRLESAGDHVVIDSAHHGREALTQVEQAMQKTNENTPAYDLIFMDKEMPVMDGITATKKIRALESEMQCQHRSSILFLTATRTDLLEARIKAAGGDACLHKPIVIASVEAALLTYLVQPQPCPQNQKRSLAPLFSEGAGQRRTRDLKKTATPAPFNAASQAGPNNPISFM